MKNQVTSLETSRRFKEKKVKCPNCKKKMEKVMYLGLPMVLCEHCNTLDGFWSWIFEVIPFNGVFFAYEGGYLSGLYDYLFGKQNEG